MREYNMVVVVNVMNGMIELIENLNESDRMNERMKWEKVNLGRLEYFRARNHRLSSQYKK